MSLPAKVTKILSHRFSSATRHGICLIASNAVRSDFGASFLRNGISFRGQGKISLQPPFENTNHIQRTGQALKNHSTIFAQGEEKKKNRGRTHPHTVSTFLFQHERLRGSKWPHLPQDKPKNDSTKSKTPKTVQGVSLRYAPVVGSLLRRSLRFDFRRTGDVV